MITLNFPYGKGVMPLHIDEKNLKAVIECEGPKNLGDSETELIEKALAEPIGSAPLCEVAEGKKNILVITSDHTRPVPSALTLPPMLREIRKGSPDADITIIVSTGTHRATTEEEMRAKFGDAIVDNEKVVVHRCMEDEQVYMGKLPSGCEFYANALAAKADLIVSDGFIEPHFFAGFSGGRKSILPGIASRESVHENHCAKLIGHEKSRAGVLEGNIIHEDMLAAAKMAGLKFILNVVLHEKKVIAAFAGDLEKAHEAGCAFSKKMFAAEGIAADIVFTSNGGYPLDQNVYQSVKSMSAAEMCVNKGGVIVCVSKCSDGSGGEHFVRWFTDKGTVAEVNDIINATPSKETKVDQWQAQILVRVMLKATVIMVADKANKELIESMGMKYAESADEAYEMAKAITGSEEIAAIPDGVSVIIEGV